MSEQSQSPARPNRSHQEIFSDVHSLAQAIANLTEAVPVECGEWDADGIPMKTHDDSKAVQDVNHFYAVVAYRWGDSNGHWYFVYVGPDQVKAVALARAEVSDRGGKYAAAVYQFDATGVDYELIHYSRSMTEHETKEPKHNHRRDYYERLGQFLDSACNGECLLPNPSDPGLMQLLKVDVPDYMKQERTRQRETLRHMTEADNREPTRTRND